MDQDKLTGTRVKRLLGALSEHSATQLTEAELDLVRTGTLLSETVEKLGTSFFAIHDLLREQNAAIGEVIDGRPEHAALAARLQAMQGQIGTRIGEAVTCLQFQDITGQLVSRSVRRVTGLRDLMGELSARSAGAFPENVVDGTADLLNRIEKVLAEQKNRQEEISPKSVLQTHMASGEITLF